MKGTPRASTTLLDELNPVQRRAVTHEGGALLVLAGAGSGKTRLLTHRIAWLVRERGVDPGRILAVTFTNKAAGEMRARLAELLAGSLSGLWIGTFHALCLRWLRLHAAAAGYSAQPSVLDQEDQLALVRELLKGEGFDDGPRRARELHALIGRAKNRAESAEEFAAAARTPAARLAARLYALYEAALRERNAVDFDDLLLGALRLFERHAEIADRYAERFEHVLVDEYQDTNHVQFRLLERLARRHRRIAVVGDDDQSIYGWRGADVRNILDFKRHFPEPTVLTLDQNYRSTRPILEFAHEVIRHNADRWDKRLWTEREGGALPEFRLAADEDEEAEAVLEKIESLRRRGERRWSDIALFYRTHAQSRPVEEACLRRGVPYQIVGGVHFFARREVKDLLSYLRLLVFPRDEAALARALSAPRRGVGPRSLAALREEARAFDGDLLRAAAAGGGAGLRAAAALRQFGEMMLVLVWRDRLDEPPERILGEIVERTGFERHLEEQGDDGQERLANVRELLESARLFSSRESEAGVAEYLDQASLMAGVDLLPEGADAITLMTVHNAKGLEFPVVFVVGLEEGLLPHASALEDTAELAEERRLFYVACTRAREELHLSASEERRRYSPSVGGLSRFMAEVSRDRYRIVPVGGGAGAARGGWGGARPHAGTASGLRGWGKGAGAREAAIDPGEHPLVGRRVHHASFGSGLVTAAEGAGDRMRITVRFHSGATRKVLKSYLEWEA